MCNAWNHSPECDCGWGGSGRGNGGGFYTSLSSSLPKTSSDENDGEKAETYRTKCGWCGATVFYHTNGFGDCVLFDSLGSPWEIHSCWEEYWKEEKDRRRVLNSFSNQQNRAKKKRIIIMGAVRKLTGITFGTFGFYGATEEAVARQLGLSVLQLRQGYGDIYKVDSAGIRLEQITQSQILIITKNIDSSLVSMSEYTEIRTFKVDQNYQFYKSFKRWDNWLQNAGFQVLNIRSATNCIRKIKAFSRKNVEHINFRLEIDFDYIDYNFNSYSAKVKITGFAPRKSEAKDMVNGFFNKIENLTKI